MKLETLAHFQSELAFLVKWSPGPHLLTWVHFNPSIDHVPSKVKGEITYPFPNFNGCTVEVWELIGNFIPHFIINEID